MSDKIVYYNLHEVLNEINQYICNINLPNNIILPDQDEPYNLTDILNHINRYICEIQPDPNCILSPSPGNINQVLQSLTDYVGNIQLGYDCIDIDTPTDLYSVIDGITDYLCNIPLEYTCTAVGATSDLYSILNDLNNYLCRIYVGDNCVTSNERDNLHNILQDIVNYICNIELEYNCMAAPNPGSLHDILNAIARYVCVIPLCENCVINRSDIPLHDGINAILEYICHINVGDNCITIQDGSNVEEIMRKFVQYLCEIPIRPDNCIGLDTPIELHDVLQGIIDYICEIPVECDTEDISGTKTLYEVIGLIIQLYCFPQKIPIFHFCVDIDGLNDFITIELITDNPGGGIETSDYSTVYTYDDFLGHLEALLGRQFSTDERNNIIAFSVVEIKNFLHLAYGNQYKDDEAMHDMRLWMSVYPNPDWHHNHPEIWGMRFHADVGDYGWARYRAVPQDEVCDYNNPKLRVQIGPRGVATVDDIDPPQSAIDWENEYNTTIIRDYSQRTRVSYRLHIIAGHRDVLYPYGCDDIDTSFGDAGGGIDPGSPGTPPPGGNGNGVRSLYEVID